MRSLKLEAYLAEIAARKKALGIDVSPEAIEALRNKGTRRTAAKREALSLAEQRARAAGLMQTPRSGSG
jgi:hypothetical protein